MLAGQHIFNEKKKKENQPKISKKHSVGCMGSQPSLVCCSLETSTGDYPY